MDAKNNTGKADAADTTYRGVSPAAHASVSGGAGAEDKPATIISQIKNALAVGERRRILVDDCALRTW